MENTVKLVCPITHNPFIDPVLLACDGYTYERQAIEEWISKGHELTPTGLPLSSKPQLIKNVAIGNETVFKDPILVGENGLTYEHAKLLAMVEDTIKTDRPIILEGMMYHSIQCYQNKALWLDGYDPERKPLLVSKYSCGTTMKEYIAQEAYGWWAYDIQKAAKELKKAHPERTKKEWWDLAAKAWREYEAKTKILLRP